MALLAEAFEKPHGKQGHRCERGAQACVGRAEACIGLFCGGTHFTTQVARSVTCGKCGSHSLPHPTTAIHDIDIHPYPTIYDTTHPSMHEQALAQMLLHSSIPPMPPISRHAIPPTAIHDPSIMVIKPV